MEVEFPPLLETRNIREDYTDIEFLDANRNFAVQLSAEKEIQTFAPDDSQWLCFPTDDEARRAREAWPGTIYQKASFGSQYTAIDAMGGDSEKPPDYWLAKWFGKPMEERPAEKPKLHLVIQPGDQGNIPDYYNLERLKLEGVPMICVNAALQKVAIGYYIQILAQEKLKALTRNFISKFEAIFYLERIGKYTGAFDGWLYRVYPEPWQVHRVVRGDGEYKSEFVKTYDERPSRGECERDCRR
jgi:hypothetical protein